MSNKIELVTLEKSRWEEALAKIEELEDLCRRAYCELSDTWDEHTDSDGYGPASLERHLKKAGRISEYEELKKKNIDLLRDLSIAIEKVEELEKELEQVADLKSLLDRLRKPPTLPVDQCPVCHIIGDLEGHKCRDKE